MDSVDRPGHDLGPRLHEAPLVTHLPQTEADRAEGSNYKQGDEHRSDHVPSHVSDSFHETRCEDRSRMWRPCEDEVEIQPAVSSSKSLFAGGESGTVLFPTCSLFAPDDIGKRSDLNCEVRPSGHFQLVGIPYQISVPVGSSRGNNKVEVTMFGDQGPHGGIL